MLTSSRFTPILLVVKLLTFFTLASPLGSEALAEISDIKVVSREPVFFTSEHAPDTPYERIVLSVHYRVDPTLAQNRRVHDIERLPADENGFISFSGDAVILQAVYPSDRRGSAIVELTNRGNAMLFRVMSFSTRREGGHNGEDLGDGFPFGGGYTYVALGWQPRPTGSVPELGILADIPLADVSGPVRLDLDPSDGAGATRIEVRGPSAYCKPSGSRDSFELFYRFNRNELEPVKVESISFEHDAAANTCFLIVPEGNPVPRGLLGQVVVQARGSFVGGLGLVAARDFAEALKGDSDKLGPVAAVDRVVGFGYSQSGRALRSFLRDGFNETENGRRAFDGLFIAAAGAGGASLNHRFPQPDQAGNSVRSLHRPVDVPPFASLPQDGISGLLRLADRTDTTPSIFQILTSTEYWSRHASLLHTRGGGVADARLHPSERIYLLAGTVHGASAPELGGRQFGSFALENDRYVGRAAAWMQRALLDDLDFWLSEGVEPPKSTVPRIDDGTLVTFQGLNESIRQFPRPPFEPSETYPLDFGPQFETNGVISLEPPKLGEDAWPNYVPQVGTHGNEVAGIQFLHLRAPLARYAGWNPTSQATFAGLGLFAPLQGSIAAFPFNQRDSASGPWIRERYGNRETYERLLREEAEALVAERLLRKSDVERAVQEQLALWDAIEARSP